MATITVKHMTETLHRELKRRAARHRRSLNQEILTSLEASIHSAPVDVETLLARVRLLRRQVSGQLTDRRLRLLKQHGRA